MAVAVVGLGTAAGCGGGTASADGGGDGGPGDPGSHPSPQGLSCADLFDPTMVRTYNIEISADEWNKMVAEFNDVADLVAGISFTTYHPIVFHTGNETVTDAAVKLHGQSSWLQTVMFDGDRAKMQFDDLLDRHRRGLRHRVPRVLRSPPGKS